ncbi:MAG: hypothetical protein BGO31_02995 [Bacteroidetes bacterium 43-16]|nr:MAG: hypothetical protein BGO31_02995 [Bacteroidetes bacterium 43-16]
MKLNVLSKYGTLITAAILIVVAAFTWWIKYPETVATRSTLTGINAPKPVIAKQNLRLLRLFTENNQQVQEGQVIGVLETTAKYEEVLKLEKMLDTIASYFEQNQKDLIKQLIRQPYQHLGEVQSDYQSFIQAYIPYRDYVLGDYAGKKKAYLQKDLDMVHQSGTVLNEQKQLQQKDLGLSETTIDKNKKLLEEQLISEQEYRELSSQYLSKQMSEPQMKSSYIGNATQINAIHKELTEIDNQVLTQQSLFQQSVLQLKHKIALWKQNYLLVASSTGRLVFTSFIQENQQLAAGKVVAHIVSPLSDIYLETLVPQANFGKVAIGQKVILKFDAYPWQEFGTVTGKVAYISPVPADSGYYLAKVILPNQLHTNYKKEIPFVEGLIAESAIVTRDLRLAESLYFDLLKTIKQ